MRRHCTVLAIVGLVTLAGCGSLGPKTVVRDTFNYNSAIAESSKNQLLQNIVRIRYADMPIFLEVSSIVNQYEVKSNASARVDGELAPFTFGGSYTERPTISYTPLSGEKFIRSLMTPLAPEIVVHLIEVGWPARLVLGLSVQAINGIYNQSGGGLVSHPGDTRFDSLVSSIAIIQRSGVLVSEIEQHDGETDMLLMFREHPDSRIQSEIASVMKLLMLDPDIPRFRVSAGICPTESDEIKLRTRSILMIIHALAMGIEVPKSQQGETIDSTSGPVENNTEDLSHVKIRSGKSPPEDSYAAIQYRNYWFWIDNGDVRSKRAFSFVQLLMNLSEGGGERKTPVLTLPTG